MKFRNSFPIGFIALILSIACASFAGDGTWSNNAEVIEHYPGAIIYFKCTVDSIDTLTSRSFTLSRWDGANFSTSPIWYQRTLNSAAGTPKITTYIQGSFDGSTWVAVDTLGSAVTTESTTQGSIDLNNKKFPYYRFIDYGVALNHSDTIDRWWFYMYHKD